MLRVKQEVLVMSSRLRKTPVHRSQSGGTCKSASLLRM